MAVYEQSQEESASGQPAGQRGFRLLLTGACLVVVLAGMRAAAAFFVPVVLAFFLSVLSYPLLKVMRSRGLPHWVAMLFTVLVNVGVLALVINAGGNLLLRFQKEIPGYVRGIKKYADEGAAWLEQQGVQDVTLAVDQALDWQALSSYANNQNLIQGLTSAVGSTVGTVASLMSSTTLVIILMVFILGEAYGTRARFTAIQMAGGPDFSQVTNSASDIQKYLGIKTAISGGTGLLAGVWCWLFDLPYPLLWAIVAFVLNFIPVVGSLMAGIPPVLVALVQFGPGSAFGVLLGYLAINMALGTFLEPLLLGRRFGASPLVVVLSVIFWGWMWGGVGMFLAVPLTMMVKMMLDHSTEFQWLSVAMAKKKVKKGEVTVMANFDLDSEQNEWLGGGASTEIPGRGERDH